MILKFVYLFHRGPCFPIKIPEGDPMDRECMQFVRSLPYTLPDGSKPGKINTAI